MSIIYPPLSPVTETSKYSTFKYLGHKIS